MTVVVSPISIATFRKMHFAHEQNPEQTALALMILDIS